MEFLEVSDAPRSIGTYCWHGAILDGMSDGKLDSNNAKWPVEQGDTLPVNDRVGERDGGLRTLRHRKLVSAPALAYRIFKRRSTIVLCAPKARDFASAKHRFPLHFSVVDCHNGRRGAVVAVDG